MSTEVYDSDFELRSLTPAQPGCYRIWISDDRTTALLERVVFFAPVAKRSFDGDDGRYTDPRDWVAPLGEMDLSSMVHNCGLDYLYEAFSEDRLVVLFNCATPEDAAHEAVQKWLCVTDGRIKLEGYQSERSWTVRELDAVQH